MADRQGNPEPCHKESAMFPVKPTLQAPLTGQALRQSVAAHRTAEWTAYAQALRIAGYRVDPARLVEQLLRHGCASVEDAFGHEVSVQVRVPKPAVVAEAPGRAVADPHVDPAAEAEPSGFHIAC
jgi:hypothetical protein